MEDNDARARKNEEFKRVTFFSVSFSFVDTKIEEQLVLTFEYILTNIPQPFKSKRKNLSNNAR